MSIPQGWESILDANEKILWQGRPDGAVTLRPRNILMLIFGLFFAGFALFWMVMAFSAGGGFWMFGLIHFSVGVGIVFSAVFWGAFKRQRSWYTLTDHRAIIASDLPLIGKRLKSWPITAESVLELEQGPPDTVNFAEKIKRGKNGSYTVSIGFERIESGQDVYRLLRDVQANAGARSLLDV
ncbi:MAG: aspartate carbamoyltransferase catalytic subunit [Rhodobacteraceae bacterium]|nr:aspartate carbamoyltransferase catalytic subunit [Paracoccaceae bacterium]